MPTRTTATSTSPTMALKLGLKIWSTNTDWFSEAADLCDRGIFDLIELYLVPGTTLEQIRPLSGLPVRIHAPHENHGFDPFTYAAEHVRQFRELIYPAATLFGSPTVVVHSGVGDDEARFAHQLALIADPRLLVENMPFRALDGRVCFGHSLRQLTYIRQTLGRPLCIDLGHAVKSANSQSLPYQRFISDIVATLQPDYFHLSDGDQATDHDEHLDLGQGTYDLSWMKQLLTAEATRRDVAVILEVPKNGRDLKNDQANASFWRGLR